MNTMGYFLKDFDPNSYVHDYVRGERYIPLLFLALEHRSVSSAQCLMELGLPALGRMYMTKSEDSTNSRCVSFRTRAEELECFDIIGLMNDLEDDSELKEIFKQHTSSSKTAKNVSTSVSAQPMLRQSRLVERETKSQACVLC